MTPATGSAGKQARSLLLQGQLSHTRSQALSHSFVELLVITVQFRRICTAASMHSEKHFSVSSFLLV